MTDHAEAPQGLEEREAEVYRLTVVNRLTQAAIGRRLGISQERVSQILANVRAKLPPVDLEAARRESLELHLDTLRAALELAEMPGTPVFVGKDGTMAFDTDGNPVRDYSLRIAARELARKADAQIRKLYGLDAPQKIEQSGSVTYEVVGVNTDLLK